MSRVCLDELCQVRKDVALVNLALSQAELVHYIFLCQSCIQELLAQINVTAQLVKSADKRGKSCGLSTTSDSIEMQSVHYSMSKRTVDPGLMKMLLLPVLVHFLCFVKL